jgi:hypothetical protein
MLRIHMLRKIPSSDEKSHLSVKSINIALKPNKNVQAQREDEKHSWRGVCLKELEFQSKISTPTNKSIIEAGLANKTIDVGYVSSSDAISFADNEVAQMFSCWTHSAVLTLKARPIQGALLLQRMAMPQRYDPIKAFQT